MTNQRKLLLIASSMVLILLALLFAMHSFNSNAAVRTFDKSVWQTDISKRNEMAYPINVGMNKAEVLALLGKPDFEASKGAEWTTTFVYKVPQNSSKAVRFIDFKGDVVDRLGFDDSGDEYYHDVR